VNGVAGGSFLTSCSSWPVSGCTLPGTRSLKPVASYQILCKFAKSIGMKNRIIGIYSITLGICILGMWIFILNTQEIEEGKTEMGFHLTSEFLMAVVCLFGGFLLLKKHKMARKLNVLGLGMVLYSVLNAAGYYAERNETAMVVMFAVLMVLTTSALLLNLFDKQER
jgi:hypothetical protein